MICYFSDAGVTEKDELFMHQFTKHRLISYHYKSAVHKIIKICKENDIAKDVNLMIDSGAYSIWNSGKPPLKVQIYAQFCEKVLKECDGRFKLVEFINLDKIPGIRNIPVTKEHIEEAQIISWDNYEFLDSRIPNMMPVFHQGDHYKYLNMIRERTRRYCISPANDKSTPQKLAWCNDVFGQLDETDKPHGLGFSSSTVAKRNAWHSFDAATHALRAAFGTVVYNNGHEMMDIVFSDVRGPVDCGTHFYNYKKDEQKVIADSLLEIGEEFTIENLFTDSKLRRLANVYYMAKYYRNFDPPKQIIQENLFQL